MNNFIKTYLRIETFLCLATFILLFFPESTPLLVAQIVLITIMLLLGLLKKQDLLIFVGITLTIYLLLESFPNNWYLKAILLVAAIGIAIFSKAAPPELPSGQIFYLASPSKFRVHYELIALTIFIVFLYFETSTSSSSANRFPYNPAFVFILLIVWVIWVVRIIKKYLFKGKPEKGYIILQEKEIWNNFNSSVISFKSIKEAEFREDRMVFHEKYDSHRIIFDRFEEKERLKEALLAVTREKKIPVNM